MTKVLEKTKLFATGKKELLKDVIEGIIQHTSKCEPCGTNILSCVHIVSKDDRLQFVVIDGNILAILNLPLDIHEQPEKEIIVNIPVNSLKIILPLLKSKEGNKFIQISLTKDTLILKDPITETELIINQFLEADFPKYEQLIPDINSEKFRKFALNYQYLKQISKTLSSPRTAGLVFHQAGVLEGIVMKRMGIKHALSNEDMVLLMPIQVNDN